MKAARGLEAPFVLTGSPTADTRIETVSMIARFLRGSLGFIPRQYSWQAYLSFSENRVGGLYTLTEETARARNFRDSKVEIQGILLRRFGLIKSIRLV